MLFKKKTSDLIYTLVPVHFVGCVHITSQKPTETIATRDPKHRKHQSLITVLDLQTLLYAQTSILYEVQDQGQF